MAEKKIEYKTKEPAIKLLILDKLTGTQYESIAAKLADEFIKANVNVKNIHNAPVLITTTHGADIYEVIRILEAK